MYCCRLPASGGPLVLVSFCPAPPKHQRCRGRGRKTKRRLRFTNTSPLPTRAYLPPRPYIQVAVVIKITPPLQIIFLRVGFSLSIYGRRRQFNAASASQLPSEGLTLGGNGLPLLLITLLPNKYCLLLYKLLSLSPCMLYSKCMTGICCEVGR
jgi:hypothetical protein